MALMLCSSLYLSSVLFKLFKKKDTHTPKLQNKNTRVNFKVFKLNTEYKNLSSYRILPIHEIVISFNGW